MDDDVVVVEERDERFRSQRDALHGLLVEDAEPTLDVDDARGVVERRRGVVAGEEADLPVAHEEGAEDHDFADGGQRGRSGDASGCRVGVGEGGAHVGHDADRRLQRTCSPVSVVAASTPRSVDRWSSAGASPTGSSIPRRQSGWVSPG